MATMPQSRIAQGPMKLPDGWLPVTMRCPRKSPSSSGCGSAKGHGGTADYGSTASIKMGIRGSASCNSRASSALTHARASCPSETSMSGRPVLDQPDIHMEAGTLSEGFDRGRRHGYPQFLPELTYEGPRWLFLIFDIPPGRSHVSGYQ